MPSSRGTLPSLIFTGELHLAPYAESCSAQARASSPDPASPELARRRGQLVHLIGLAAQTGDSRNVDSTELAQRTRLPAATRTQPGRRPGRRPRGLASLTSRRGRAKAARYGDRRGAPGRPPLRALAARWHRPSGGGSASAWQRAVTVHRRRGGQRRCGSASVEQVSIHVDGKIARSTRAKSEGSRNSPWRTSSPCRIGRRRQGLARGRRPSPATPRRRQTEPPAVETEAGRNVRERDHEAPVACATRVAALVRTGRPASQATDQPVKNVERAPSDRADLIPTGSIDAAWGRKSRTDRPRRSATVGAGDRIRLAGRAGGTRPSSVVAAKAHLGPESGEPPGAIRGSANSGSRER